MPLIDVICESGHVHEVVRPLDMWPQTPACPECGSKTEQTMLPKSVQWTPDPIVVYKAPDGYRYPGDANGRSAKYYEKLGYERVELRGAAEVRRFEKDVNSREFSKAARKQERAQAVREEMESRNRSTLRSQMTQMSEFGKSLAREAMRRNDAKEREHAKSPGFHSDVYSNSRSNRDESRDAQGRRRRD